ncbi:hypothetical protein GGD63_001091 [Bradyrhizobium sp. cir1]|uniref:hypothetical protein n=1 Tax=Bradyrhizobium sp. cir1 TaxID=1445730 RepID=UPI00160628DD|nr:hypothetical protein [Bradyrhizobium sp. cir1]MBB4368312.1 hypothetical protein [Bradyrhizobium sp. cir1]
MRTISRKELFEQVWSRPMTKVAADYGVTSTALKKTCKRHKIPTPERGYWAKREHQKPVRNSSLPKLPDTRLDQIRISGGTSRRLPEQVIKAGAEALERLMTVPETAAATATDVEEPSILRTTRRAISKARPDVEGFSSTKGRGIVPLKIAPNSIDRAFRLLGRFFALAETEGYRPRISDTGLELEADNVSIAFGVEERPRKMPHEPTVAELKRRDDNFRRGLSSPPLPKYDYSPSGRLSIVIHANAWSGLRCTYSDHKTQSVEAILPAVIAGLAEHAALIRERKRDAEERERQYRDAEVRRKREETFVAREKRRVNFVEAVHAQLLERSRLSAVLAHLDDFSGDDASRVQTISVWIRRRIKQIDALTGPAFLDLSARSAKLGFVEQLSDPDRSASGGYYDHLSPIRLQFWSIDEEKELATSISSLEWATRAGLLQETGIDNEIRDETGDAEV